MADRAVLERIKKLLELAKSPCNEHEAALAAEKARELLDEHNLSLGEVEIGAAPSAEEHFLCPENPPRYLAVLVRAVEILFDCASILSREGLFGPSCIALCGVPQNVEAAALTLHYFKESAHALCRARRSLLIIKSRRSARANQRRLISYRYGVAARILDEIEKARARAQADANRAAIVHVSNAVAKRHIAEHYPNRRIVRRRNAEIEPRSFGLGFADGERVNPAGLHKSLPGEVSNPEDHA
jgi:hypothetical protein